MNRCLVLDSDRPPVFVWLGYLDSFGWICELCAGSQPVFAGYSEHRKHITAVRNNVDRCCCIIEVQQHPNVSSYLRIEPPIGEHYDTVVALTQAEFGFRSDHPGRGMTVGLSNRNRKVSR